MPRSDVVVRLKITGHILIRSSMFLQSAGSEQASPYSPPVRLLCSQLEAAGRAIMTKAAPNTPIAAFTSGRMGVGSNSNDASIASAVFAELVETKRLNSSVATFVF